jgi:uncharacterized protein
MHQLKNKENIPLLAHFRTSNNFYIYDAPTNEILRVNEELWNVTSTSLFWESIGKAQEKNYYSHSKMFPNIDESIFLEIKKANKNKGLFGVDKPGSLSLLIEKEELNKELKENIGQLILCMSEQCNLRCDYCVYSGSYGNQRQHNNRFMDYDTARTAVDFYIKNSHKRENKFIGFYGGEPTFNFSTIKKIVEYIKDKYKEEKINYNITTNAYNLSDEMLEFFILHKFHMLISIDGPMKTHNRFRKRPDGSGTFENVYDTLRRIEMKDKDFFKSYIGLSIVTGPPYNIKELKDFFDNDHLLKNTRFNISGIIQENTTFFDDPKIKALNSVELPVNSDYNSMKKEYKLNLISGTPYKSRFLASLFEKELLRIHKRTLYPYFSNEIYPNGICQPGARKIFVSTKGKIHVCERVDSTMEIGDIYKGFCLDCIFAILQKYIDESNQSCLDCYANRFCHTCFAECFSASGFHKKEKEKLCNQIRSNFIVTLADYCEILEANPNAFDFAKNIEFA